MVHDLFRHFVLLAIFLTCAVVFCSCNKASSLGPQNVADIQAEWNNTVNSLLDYVPENTPVLIASTHHFDAGNGLAAMVLGPFVRSFRNTFTETNAVIERACSDEPSVCMVLKGLRSFGDLAADYSGQAKSWGLHENGHDDFVFYMNGMLPVMKFTTEDSAAFRTRLWQGIGVDTSNPDAYDLLGKRIEVGENPWFVLDLTEELCGSDGDLRHDWVCRNYGQPQHYGIAVAAHYGLDGVVTYVFLADADESVLPGCLKHAVNPVKSTRFAGLKKDVLALGYFDHVKMADLMKSRMASWSGQIQEGAGDSDDDDIDTYYFREMSQMLSKFSEEYPHSEYFLKLNGTRLGMHYSLQFSDTNRLNQIQQLKVPMDRFSNQNIAGFRIGIKTAKVLSMLTEYIQRAEQNSDDKDRGRRVLATELYHLLSDPPMDVFIPRLEGLIFELGKLHFGEDRIDAEGKIDVWGSELPVVVGELYDMFSTYQSVPEIGTSRDFGMMDLSGVFSGAIRERMTENHYILSTASYENAKQDNVDEHLFAELRVTRLFGDAFADRVKHARRAKGILRDLCGFTGEEYDGAGCLSYPSRFLGMMDDASEFDVLFGTDNLGITVDSELDLRFREGQ
ncbi:MAG: hypothetical protein IJM59_03415 [Proteobacteria bacterium]|nr:hypothetical protein [Pseudomonadota bacterium]